MHRSRDKAINFTIWISLIVLSVSTGIYHLGWEGTVYNHKRLVHVNWTDINCSAKKQLSSQGVVQKDLIYPFHRRPLGLLGDPAAPLWLTYFLKVGVDSLNIDGSTEPLHSRALLPTTLTLSWCDSGYCCVLSWLQAKVPSGAHNEKQAKPFQMFQPMALIYRARIPKDRDVSFPANSSRTRPECPWLLVKIYGHACDLTHWPHNTTPSLHSVEMSSTSRPCLHINNLLIDQFELFLCMKGILF